MPLTTITTSPASTLDPSLAATAAPVATVVLRDVASGWTWGWCHDPEPLFHLVPLGPGHRGLGRVRLEDRYGRRVFDPEGQFPTGVLEKLARLVVRHRKAIETAWCRQVAGMGLLVPVVEPGNWKLGVRIYVGTPCERTRVVGVNWSGILGGRKPDPEDVEIDAELGDLVVGAREAEPIRVPLRLLVLVGRTAAFDSVAIAEPDPASMRIS